MTITFRARYLVIKQTDNKELKYFRVTILHKQTIDS
jgi:hypothetical protein